MISLLAQHFTYSVAYPALRCLETGQGLETGRMLAKARAQGALLAICHENLHHNP